MHSQGQVQPGLEEWKGGGVKRQGEEGLECRGEGSGGGGERSLHAALARTHIYRPLRRPFAHVQVSPCVCICCLKMLHSSSFRVLPGKRWPMLPPGGNAEVGDVPLPYSEALRLSWSRQRALCPGVGAALSFRTLGLLMVVQPTPNPFFLCLTPSQGLSTLIV